MTSLGKRTSRTRRAAAVGLLLAVPLLPVAGCGEGGDAGADRGGEVEDGQSPGEDDDGVGGY